MQREKPGPGQESVWDYPRPPKLEKVSERITVELNGKVSKCTGRKHAPHMQVTVLRKLLMQVVTAATTCIVGEIFTAACLLQHGTYYVPLNPQSGSDHLKQHFRVCML